MGYYHKENSNENQTMSPLFMGVCAHVEGAKVIMEGVATMEAEVVVVFTKIGPSQWRFLSRKEGKRGHLYWSP